MLYKNSTIDENTNAEKRQNWEVNWKKHTNRLKIYSNWFYGGSPWKANVIHIIMKRSFSSATRQLSLVPILNVMDPILKVTTVKCSAKI